MCSAVRKALVTVPFALVAVTACSGSGANSDGEATGLGHETPPPPPRATVDVEIGAPRDLGAAADDPCSLLTPEQVEQLGPGMVPTETELPDEQRDCTWANGELRVRITPDTTTGEGIEYKLGQPDVERTDVDGYPGARYGQTESSCAVSVGVAEQTELIVLYTRLAGAAERPSCEAAESIAAMAIGNLPAAA